jgi:hypothetical protein
VCHLREFLPTEEISRGTGAPVPLPYLSPSAFADERARIDALTFLPIGGTTPMAWEQSLYANHTDGILVLFPAAVAERIARGGDPARFAGFPTLPGGSYTSQLLRALATSGTPARTPRI